MPQAQRRAEPEADQRPAKPESASPSRAEPQPEATRVCRPHRPRRGNGGRIKASPLARRIARERGIDLAALAGTGPEGRIVAEDVERAAVSAAEGGACRARRRPPRSSGSSSPRCARRSRSG